MTNGIPRDLNDLLSFASSIHGYVEDSSPWRLRRDSAAAKNLLTRGPLALSFTADVVLPDSRLHLEFELHDQPLAVLPTVRSAAPWLRRDIEWHVFDDGKLCWAYPRHYFELIHGLSRHLDEQQLVQTAACWCVSKSAELVHRHLIADQTALRTWPTEWNAWPHGIESAQAQFHEMKRRGEFAAEIRQLLAARQM